MNRVILITGITLLLFASCAKTRIKKMGCESTNSLTIVDSCNLFVPNVFTPNGDGLNDVFLPSCDCPITNYKMVIENHKGKEVFSTTDQTEAWNGTNSKGKNVEEDMYRCIITGTLSGLDLNYNETLLRVEHSTKYHINRCSQCVYPEDYNGLGVINGVPSEVVCKE